MKTGWIVGVQSTKQIGMEDKPVWKIRVHCPFFGIRERKSGDWMGKIFVTSDLHLCHDKDFLWKARGFSSIEEHDQTLIENWNNVVMPEDTVYVLGDMMFRSRGEKTLFDDGLEKLRQLNGKLIIIRGNHDSMERIRLYEQCENVVSANNAALYIRYPETGGYNFYLSHYPTLISPEKIRSMKAALINLYGHTHQKEPFFRVDGREHPYMYCCCMDAHNCTPVLLDDVIEEIRKKRAEWQEEFSEI